MSDPAEVIAAELDRQGGNIYWTSAEQASGIVHAMLSAGFTISWEWGYRTDEERLAAQQP